MCPKCHGPRKVRHPSKIVSVGEEIEAVVLDIKPENRRISLGMKQVAPNPWDVISEKYPLGTIIEGKIKNITDFGLFIGSAKDEGLTAWSIFRTSPGPNGSNRPFRSV